MTMPRVCRKVLAQRLRQVRVECYGEQGTAALAADLDLPERTWLNYEAGVAMPAEVLLNFIGLTRTNPSWLLEGEGDRYLVRSRPDWVDSESARN
jgi:hypothetical protein